MQIVNLRTSVLVCMKHTVQGGKNRQGNRLVLDGWNLIVCDVCGRVRVRDVIFKYWQILQHGILEIWFRCRRDIQNYFLSFIHKSNSQDSPLSAPNSFSTATDQAARSPPSRLRGGGSEWPEGRSRSPAESCRPVLQSPWTYSAGDLGWCASNRDGGGRAARHRQRDYWRVTVAARGGALSQSRCPGRARVSGGFGAPAGPGGCRGRRAQTLGRW